MSQLEIDDNHCMHAFESVIFHIYRAMDASDPEYNQISETNVDDVYIDSIEPPEALRIDHKSGNGFFREGIWAEVCDNLIRDTGTLKPVSNHEVVQSMLDVINIPTTIKCKPGWIIR